MKKKGKEIIKVVSNLIIFKSFNVTYFSLFLFVFIKIESSLIVLRDISYSPPPRYS